MDARKDALRRQDRCVTIPKIIINSRLSTRSEHYLPLESTHILKVYGRPIVQICFAVRGGERFIERSEFFHQTL